MTETKENKKGEFHQLPDDLQKLVFEIERDKIIKMDLNSGILPRKRILKSQDLYNQTQTYLDNNYKNISRDIIDFIIYDLYTRKRPLVEFWKIQLTFESLQRKYQNQPTFSIGKKKDPSPGEKINDVNEDSLGHSNSPTNLNFKELYTWLEENKWSYNIWISKLDRDHNKNCMGQMDPGGSAFQKLVTGYKLRFENQNTWETIVKKDQGLYWSWAMNINGYVRFWINDNLSWELFFDTLHKELEICNLTELELKEFIEVLKANDGKGDQLFFLETANLIGPRDVIEKHFNKACLVYKQTYYNGLYLSVLILIDKSKGPYEIEFKGPEGPTKKLQDITVRPFETVESLGRFEFLQNSNLQITSANNGMIQVLQQNMDQLKTSQINEDLLNDKFSKVESKLFGMEIQNELDQIQIIDLIQNKVWPRLKDNLTLIKNENDYEHSKVRQYLANLIASILNLDTNINNSITSSQTNIEDLVIQTSNDIRTDLSNKIDVLDQNISNRFDNLEKLVYSEFKQVKFRVKNSLYWILQKLDLIPGLTAKEIANELKVSQKAVYSYLKQLQDRNFIYSQSTKKTKKPGRPPAIFKLNLKTILKKLKGSD